MNILLMCSTGVVNLLNKAKQANKKNSIVTNNATKAKLKLGNTVYLVGLKLHNNKLRLPSGAIRNESKYNHVCLNDEVIGTSIRNEPCSLIHSRQCDKIQT